MNFKDYRIYTDGSHLKHTSGRLGIGGVLVCGQELIDEFSIELSQSYLQTMYGTSDVSNPTCELLAVYVALTKFKDYLKSAKTVVCFADYQGVQAWNEGTWRIKKPYIQKIKDNIDKEISAQGLKGRIGFSWVRGHQTRYEKYSDAYWNQITDALAKGENHD